MTTSSLHNLWPALWTDLQQPNVAWQIGVLIICIAAGWGLARLIRGKLAAKDVQARAVRFGVESFSRVLWPLITLILISIAKPILANWHHVTLLRVAIPLFGSFALIRLSFYVLRRAFARGGQAGAMLLLFEKFFALLVWVGVAVYITGLWPELVQYLDDNVVPIGRHKVTLLTIVQAGVSVVVTLVLALWGGAVLEERLMRVDGMHSSLRGIMVRTGRATLILVAILVSLSLVGIDLTVLSVFGGALGVGLGLGLQKIVSSYVSGFVILIERSLAVGDMVMVEKYFGRVTQINSRYTVLQGADGIESVVPNDMLVSGAIQNYSLSTPTVRLACQVSVDYGSNLDEIFRLLEEAAASVDRVLKEPPPAALLLKFGADGLELEVGFWITDPENGRHSAQSSVNLAIWRSFQAHQVNIPYPQREIRIIEIPQSPPI
ncbi:mechanosensitive ion channel [soil metagenome]